MEQALKIKTMAASTSVAVLDRILECVDRTDIPVIYRVVDLLSLAKLCAKAENKLLVMIEMVKNGQA